MQHLEICGAKGGSMSQLADTRLRLYLFLLFLLFVSCPIASAQEAVDPPPEETPPTAQETPPNTSPNQASSDYDRTKRSFVIPAIEIVGFNFALNRFDQRYLPDHETFEVNWYT